MSLKFFSRLRDKEKSPVKTKPLPIKPASAPRTGTELNIDEIQVISWENETVRQASYGRGGRFGEAETSHADKKTPLYEASTQKSSKHADDPGPNQPRAGSVLDRPRVATRGEPEVHARDYPTSPASDDAREELRSTNGEAPARNPDGWPVSTRKADSSRPKRPKTAGGESFKTFYRTNTTHWNTSTTSLASATVDGELHGGSKGSKKSFGGLGKKSSLHFFRRIKSPSGDSVVSSEDAASSSDDHPPPTARRSRSSSMTSLSSAVFNLRSKEKPPSLPTSHHVLTGGSVGRNVTKNRAPSSWKPATVSIETSPYLSSAYTSETDLAGSKEQGQPRHRFRAKNAMARARSIKRTVPSHSPRTGSDGSTTTSPAMPEMTSGTFASIQRPSSPNRSASAAAAAAGKADDVSADSAEPVVKVSSPGMSTIALPLGNSLNGLMATKLFQQLGPPPTGLDALAFEERVTIVMEYIDSRSINLPSQLAKVPQSPTSPRSSLPPPNKQPSLRRGISTASTEDEFDKVECQMEQEVLQMLARGAYDRSSVEELRLDAVFLEARRRSGVGYSRTHFQLFVDGVSTVGPYLTPDGRGWSNGASLGTSPRAASSSIGGAMDGDTLSGLGVVPLRPAPRRKRRPTTAPETQSSVVLGSGHLPPSPPLPRFEGVSALSARPSSTRMPRSPAPSCQSMQASDESHELASRDGHSHSSSHGLGFDVLRTGAWGRAESDGKTPAGLFTPQSFSAKPPPPPASSSSALSHDNYQYGNSASRSMANVQVPRPSDLVQFAGAPPQTMVPHTCSGGAASGHGPGGPGFNGYRRGSSDHESSSNHTTRSARSPLMTAGSYGRWSSRFSAGTRNSQDTNDTVETSESTLAGGSGQLLSMGAVSMSAYLDKEGLKAQQV